MLLNVSALEGPFSGSTSNTCPHQGQQICVPDVKLILLSSVYYVVQQQHVGVTLNKNGVNNMCEFVGFFLCELVVSRLFLHATCTVFILLRSLYFMIFSASFLITFLSPNTSTSTNMHVALALSQVMMSGLLLGMVVGSHMLISKYGYSTFRTCFY